jgi:predicted NAD-dependent protein-ADP-ribosyltransferase YbiA (DUF1768 family)
MHVIDLQPKEFPFQKARQSGAILAFEGPHRFLALAAPGRVTMYGVSFPTVAHAAAAAKIDPNDPRRQKHEAIEELWRIASEPSARRAMALGRSTLRREDWHRVRTTLLTELIRRKFLNSLLARKLAGTGKTPIIAMSPDYPGPWGMRQDEGYLAGNNWIGEILMHIRDPRD